MQVSSTRAQLLTSTFLACALSCALAGAASAQSGAAGAPVQNAAEDQAAPDPAVVQTPTAEQEARNQSGEPVSDDEAAVEAVVVTGSRIRRDPTNAPTPLIQLNREEVLQSGEANIVDYLADVPALQLSQVPEDTTGNCTGAGGLSLLNLRGLGDAAHPGAGGRSTARARQPRHLLVDVDTIPSLLIENIEVVTGAASAQYGADAVSGVVNFILRRNFQGLDIDGVIGQVNQDGQLNKRISGLLGRNFLNERLNVYASPSTRTSRKSWTPTSTSSAAAARLSSTTSIPALRHPTGFLTSFRCRAQANLALARGGSLTLSTTPEAQSDQRRRHPRRAVSGDRLQHELLRPGSRRPPSCSTPPESRVRSTSERSALKQA
jgi:outer membrane receptor protein involved in Fe transport